MTWHPGEIYKAWDRINQALFDAMKPLPRQTLVFLANRGNDGIIRAHAAEILDWQENRDQLPDWGWRVCQNEEHLRGQTERLRVNCA